MISDSTVSTASFGLLMGAGLALLFLLGCDGTGSGRNEAKTGTVSQGQVSPDRIHIRMCQTDEQGRVFLELSSAQDISSVVRPSLHTLWIHGTMVTDLSPLRGTAIGVLDVRHTAVSNIDVLSETSISNLCIADTAITSIAPIANLPITKLDIAGAPIADLHRLEGLPLVRLHLDEKQLQQTWPLLKGIRSLEWIGIGQGMAEPAANVLDKYAPHPRPRSRSGSGVK